MERNCSLEEISDGRLYGINDMVKANCNDCKGCSACCQGMGNSIVLDPLDVHYLKCGLKMNFEELLNGKIKLNVADGIILPNLYMGGEKECCAFLNQEGRCSIHAFRPGICRIFPLGRFYENESFQYFLQVYECQKKNKTKIKVSKWIDTPNLKENQKFIIRWHYYIKALQERAKADPQDAFLKQINMYILQNFYINPFSEKEDFYMQFHRRMDEIEKLK